MPLVLTGARQVGKTWLLKKFGRCEFRKTHYINFDEDREKFQFLFQDGLNPERVLFHIGIINNANMDTSKDLLIFDEIQEMPLALTALKYFCEHLPELALCCAGSHLGIHFSSTAFPVGKVDILRLYPLSFEEFLWNVNEKAGRELSAFQIETGFPTALHKFCWSELKNYFIVGGLPGVVSRYLENKDDPAKAYDTARELQKALITGYCSDFSKYSGKENANHINRIFENIPTQLQKVQDASTQRFRFKGVVPGKTKYAQLSGAVDWLLKTELALKINLLDTPAIPLTAYTKENMFKLAIFDVGILSTMLRLPFDSILNQDYGTYKGFFAENFVARELTTSGMDKLFSWSGRNSEIEFLLAEGNHIIPLEVKSGNRTRSKSLGVYQKKYDPHYCIRLSALPFEKTERLVNIPLYLAGKLMSA